MLSLYWHEIWHFKKNRSIDQANSCWGLIFAVGAYGHFYFRLCLIWSLELKVPTIYVSATRHHWRIFILVIFFFCYFVFSQIIRPISFLYLTLFKSLFFLKLPLVSCSGQVTVEGWGCNIFLKTGSWPWKANNQLDSFFSFWSLCCIEGDQVSLELDSPCSLTATQFRKSVVDSLTEMFLYIVVLWYLLVDSNDLILKFLF